MIKAIIKAIRKLIVMIKAISLVNKYKDPVRECKFYKDHGCSHVDGYLCDIETCNIRKEYEEKILNKPLV